MGSHDNPAEKAPPPKTVLSEARTGLRDEKQRLPGLDVTAYRLSEAFAERMRKTEDRTLALDDIKAVDMEVLILGATLQNQQDSKNAIKRIFGVSPTTRAITREIDNVATINRDGYSDYRPKKDLQNGYRAHVADLNEQGAAFRRATGFGVSLPKSHRVNLLGQDGRILVELPHITAAALARDPRFRPGLHLLQSAARGEAPADLVAAVTAAVEAASHGRKIGDALLFKDNEERIAAVETAFARVRNTKPGETEHRQAFQILALTLLAEALPHKQAYQLVFDMIPGLGNVRAAEDALRSIKAAGDALGRDDALGAAGHVGSAILHVLGAIGGAGVTALGKKAARATVLRHADDRLARFGEFLQLASKRESALHRAEKIVRRPAGKQLDEATRGRLNQYLATLPASLANNIRGRLPDMIGVAGEFYLEPILRRASPGILSQAQANRLIMQGNKTGARVIEEVLARTRDGHQINLDIDAKDIKSEFGRDGVLHLKFIDSNQNTLSHSGDVKTGRHDKRQMDRYEHNVGKSGVNYKDPPTINSFAFYDIRPAEFKMYIEEALRFKILQNEKSIISRGGDPQEIVKSIMRVLDVEGVEKIIQYYTAEFIIGQSARISSAMHDSYYEP